MTDKRGRSNLRLNKCALAVAMAISTSVIALDFKNESGELTGNFDTTISYGVGVRVESRDPTLVGIANGGLNSSVNGDDGNLNYDKNDVFSSLFKVTHELDAIYRNYGFFGRVYYFYDFENVDREGLGPKAKDRVGRDFRFLDAYVKGTFDVGGKRLQARVGNQVVSWGESTFIPNGINVINPVDLSRLRSPGAEIKEALLPSPMLWLSQEVTDRFSVEGFVLNKFKHVKLDPRGTYFSSNDFISDDGDTLYLAGPDQHFPAIPRTSQSVSRGPDRKAGDSGEFGIAARLLMPEWNDTEFGLYFINYHSRTPFASGTRGGVTVAGVPCPFNVPANGCTTVPARYFVEYPEDIRLYGLSFSTAGPAGIALQGEYSYRQNQPLQLAPGELVLAALGLRNSITGSSAAAATLPVGTDITGYQRVHMHQAQVTASKVLPPMWGADQIVVLGEVGYTYLDLPSGVYFGGYGETTPPTSFSSTPATATGEGFATKNSWGYRLNATMDYNNAIGAVRVSPRFAFAHDVKGVSPTFNEGVKSASVAVGFTYKEQWRADIAYTAFFGGRQFPGVVQTNSLKDRDFISVSASYSF